MGTCLSKKKESSPSFPISETNSAAPASKNSSGSGVTASKTKVQEQIEPVREVKGHVRKEIFIIKHRKSHDGGGERNSKSQQNAHQPFEEMPDKITTPAGVGVRSSSCTKDEVDAILIQCGRLSRNSSGKQATSSSASFGRRKRSNDFDHCDNDAISTEEEQQKANLCEDDGIAAAADEKRRHRQSSRSSSQERSRRRTPSREREQEHRSSSRERRVSRSPGRRSSETTTPVVNARNSSNNTSSRPGKMVAVPATVSSLVMDKSNHGGGGEFATTTSVKRIMVKRNVGAASPRSQSPARANGSAANASKILCENQQHPALSRNSSRKAEQSPHRRNPLSELEPNCLAFPHSTANNNSSSRVQNRPKKEVETEANQKPNASRTALDKDVGVNYKTKVQQEEDVKVISSMTDNVVVKTVVPSEVDNLKPQILIRSRSSRRSRDFDTNPEALLNPPQSYTSLLLEDIQNFHQKNTPPVSLPACVTKACAILEAVADLNSNSSSNFSQHGYQSSRNEYNVLFGTANGKKVQDAKDPIAEYESFVNDDVMEPSLHNYGSLGGVDMEDQESSGSNSLTQQQHYIQGISDCSSLEPSSGNSKDLCSSKLKNFIEEGQKISLGLEGRVSRDVDGARKQMSSKKSLFDHQNRSGIGHGRLGGNKVLHKRPVVTVAEST